MTTPLAEAIRVLRAAGVPVSGKVPNDEKKWGTTGRPPMFLVAKRAGGGRARSVDHMLLLVECWAPTSVEAENLAYRVDDILRLAPNQSDVISQWGGREGASISDYDDPDVTSQSRWLVTGTLHCLT